MESVDLASELEDAIYTYFELFRQEGIEVSYKGPDEDVPPIVADSERMKQVFCNVLDNPACLLYTSCRTSGTRTI